MYFSLDLNAQLYCGLSNEDLVVERFTAWSLLLEMWDFSLDYDGLSSISNCENKLISKHILLSYCSVYFSKITNYNIVTEYSFSQTM